MKCALVGSSHAARLSRFLAHKLHEHGFELIQFCIPGANFERLQFPDPEILRESDILIVIPFGNDIFERNSHQIVRSNEGKTIHLKKFAPTSESVLKELFKKLQQKLSLFKCRKFILDSFLKYVHCCPKHTSEFPRTIKHQQKCNKSLKRHFTGTDITVLDHLKLFVTPQRQGYINLKYYKMHMVDAVHFSAKTYEHMAAKLVKAVIMEK